MIRRWLWLLAFLALPSVGWTAEPLGYDVIQKSKPVEVNGLQFVAATQAQWAIRPGTSKAIVIQLWITNTGNRDIILRTYDTIFLRIKKAGGSSVLWTCGRDHTKASPSLLIRAGETSCRPLKPELTWPRKPVLQAGNARHSSGDKNRGLSFEESTAMSYFFELPDFGSYELSFHIGTSEEQAGQESRKLQGLPVWFGDAQTGAADFEIVEIR